MLAGSDTINLADWERHTVYRGCSAHHPVVKIFWQVLKRCSQDQWQQLLHEASGMLTPPLEGFQVVMPPFNIVMVPKQQASERLKRALFVAFHTCFNQIELIEDLKEDQFSEFMASLITLW
eukprot:Skav225539  [mRNA]  locus=scaffold339:53416:53778:- [translate_table: standard]